jgi:hypothetical protein
MNTKDKFISLLQKSSTQVVTDGEIKTFKITFGQLFGKSYIVLHDHPEMKGFGVFQPVPRKDVSKMISEIENDEVDYTGVPDNYKDR